MSSTGGCVGNSEENQWNERENFKDWKGHEILSRIFFCEMLKIQRHGLWSSRSWKYLKKNGEEGGNFQKVYYFPHQFVSLVVDDQSAQSVSIHVSTLDFK